MKNKNKRIAIVIIFIIVACILLIYAVFFSHRKQVIITDTAAYGDFSSHGEYQLADDITIFPTDTENIQFDEYYYVYNQYNIGDPDYQIYLKATLSDAAYESEVERLSQLAGVTYSKEDFLYPSYFTRLGFDKRENSIDYCNEYALLIGNNQIVYVYLQMADLEEIGFSKKYLPYGYQSLGICDYTRNFEGNKSELDVFLGMDIKRSYVTTNSQKYHSFFHKDVIELNGDLTIFPDSLEKDITVTEYDYEYTENEFQLFLDCSYGGVATYEVEKERISNLEGIELRDDDFSSPAYVRMLGYKKSNEYALIDDASQRIIYVYIQNIPEKNMMFDTRYLPNGYKGNGNCTETYNGYQ